MEAFRTETVETPAGEYTVELHYDQDASNPLTDWDHPGMAFYIYNREHYRNNVHLDTIDEAGRAGRILLEIAGDHNDDDEVERRYKKWAAIAESPWILVAGEDSASRDDFYRWYVLVNTAETYIASDGKSYPSLPEPVKAAEQAMETYRKWAAGEFCGYIVKGPDGDEIEFGSLWGIDDEDYAVSEATDMAKHDAAERQKKANLVGAGFVGIV